MVYALWNGGSSYSISDMSHLEEFRSIKHATETFRERAETSGAAHLNTYYADCENEAVRFPAVDETTSMGVYKYDPREGNNGPNFRLSLGPRGGIRRENF